MVNVRRPQFRSLLSALLVTGFLATGASSPGVAFGATGGFADGFETGNLSAWTDAAGVVVASGDAPSGYWAARATSSGVPAYAYARLPSDLLDIHAQLAFKVYTRASVATIMNLTTKTGAQIVGVNLRLDGALGYWNGVTLKPHKSGQSVTLGVWHHLDIDLHIGDPAGSIEVSLDGQDLTRLDGADWFGSAPVGRIQIGSMVQGRAYDVGFDDVLAGPVVDDQPPVIDSVAIDEAAPNTDEMISATVSAHDPDGPAPQLSYQWTKNGLDLLQQTQPTLDLSQGGTGDKGDEIAVEVTASDGVYQVGPDPSDPVSVVNSAPTVGVGILPSNPGTDDLVTATATSQDVDGDAVRYTYVWRVDGVVRQTVVTFKSTDVYDLSPAGAGDAGDAISVGVTGSDGTDDGPTATATATVVGGEFAKRAEPTWQVNDRVRSMVRVGDVAYVGGGFVQAMDHSGGTADRHYLLAMDTISGGLLSWDPAPNGEVRALALSADSKTLFVGGAFTSIAGAARSKLAAFDVSGYAPRLLPLFSGFSISNEVLAIGLTDKSIFIGGDFLSIDGQSRTRLAKIDISTSPGTLTQWAPGVRRGDGGTPQNVRAFVVDQASGKVVVAGWFDQAASSGAYQYDQAQKHVVAFDQVTGSILRWDNHGESEAGPTAPIDGLTSDGTSVYGALAGSGGRVVAWNLADGSLRWSYKTDGDVQAIDMLAGKVVCGMHGDYVAPDKSFTGVVGSANGIPRKKIFVLTVDGTLTPWNPLLTSTGSPLGVFALTGYSDLLLVGGDFTHVDGVGQQHFAEFEAN